MIGFLPQLDPHIHREHPTLNNVGRVGVFAASLACLMSGTGGVDQHGIFTCSAGSSAALIFILGRTKSIHNFTRWSGLSGGSRCSKSKSDADVFNSYT